MSSVGRLDRFQRKHSWIGAPLAVVYKFAEDRGPYLAALITYYGFVSLFPLLLVFSSTLGLFLEHNPDLQQKLVQSALRNFPVIGSQLRTNVGNFHGSGLALVAGVAGTLYGGLGAMQAAQTAFNRIYAVPRNEQPNPIKSRLRSIGLLLLLGGGILLSTGLATVATGLVTGLATELRIGGYIITLLIDVAVFTAAYQLLTAVPMRWRQVITGGLLSAGSWMLLQTLGTSYATHELTHASRVYGGFGLVLAAVAWIYAQAVIIVFCAEINMVAEHRLWPRALLTPFTDNVQLTEADRRAYRMHARTQRFKGFERVRADFDDGVADRGPDEQAGRGDDAERSAARIVD